jgi:hypothetical protein
MGAGLAGCSPQAPDDGAVKLLRSYDCEDMQLVPLVEAPNETKTTALMDVIDSFRSIAGPWNVEAVCIGTRYTISIVIDPISDEQIRVVAGPAIDPESGLAVYGGCSAHAVGTAALSVLAEDLGGLRDPSCELSVQFLGLWSVTNTFWFEALIDPAYDPNLKMVLLRGWQRRDGTLAGTIVFTTLPRPAGEDGLMEAKATGCDLPTWMRPISADGGSDSAVQSAEAGL